MEEISTKISERDEMFKTTASHNHPDPKLAYLNGGKMIIETVTDILKKWGPELLNGKNILDYGCGHGRVARHIKRLNPAKLVCADVWDDAVGFCAREFSADPFVISDDSPISSRWQSFFDVVISISVFSHLPPARFERNLTALQKAMRGGGILLYTTHGNFSAKKRSLTIPDSNFRYGPVGAKPNHTDGRLPVEEYSFMCTNPEYNKSMVSKAGLSLLEFREQGINEQDLYVVKKPQGTGSF